MRLRCLLNCTNQHGGAVPDPVWDGSKWMLAFPKIPVTQALPSHKPFFRRTTPRTTAEEQLYQNRSPTFSFFLPFFCPSSSSYSSRFVLSRLRCNGHSLLLSSIYLGLAESTILHAAPADTRPRTPIISFCPVQRRTHCAAQSLVTLCLFTTSGPGLESCPASEACMVFRHDPHLSKGVG